MAVSDFVKTNTHGTITLTDGLGTTLTLAYDRGDLAVSGLTRRLNEIQRIERRGHYISSAHGARKYPQITLSGYLTGEGSAAPGSMQAFLLQGTPYTANESTTGAGRPYAVDLDYGVEGTDFGDAADWAMTATDCEVDNVDFAESADGTTFSVTLVCVGSISGDIVASEIA